MAERSALREPQRTSQASGRVPLPAGGGRGEGELQHLSKETTATLVSLEHLKRECDLRTALSWRFVANRTECPQIKFFALGRMRDAAMSYRGRL